MRTNLQTIEQRVGALNHLTYNDREFLFKLLEAYGRSGGNLTRLRNGSLNVATDKSIDIAQKNIVFYRPVQNGRNVYAEIDELKLDPAVVRYNTRFVIVADAERLLAIDTKTRETLDIQSGEIGKYFTFFLPWAGMEKAQTVNESMADVKAAYKLSQLYDEIIRVNPVIGNENAIHALNVFFCRLLFCFYSEDTGIFPDNSFTGNIASHTQKDGEDVHTYLDELFFALDARDKEGYPAHIAQFPEVAGPLFHQDFPAPRFSAKARQLLIECGQLNWSEINPDIFGSMLQSVVDPGKRTNQGMHYTSVPNILKTIEPLFLDELKASFDISFDDRRKLEKLLRRISQIKVFDPACGSGNFLVIAYKELRKIEHALLERIDDLTDGPSNSLLFSHISIQNFYGIEKDDFAHEIAVLSLWLAKHQMNQEFKSKFGTEIPLLPLSESGQIVQANAARVSWHEVCPADGETYIVGNPPYGGARKQDAQQKKDMELILGHVPGYRDVDYIFIWYYLAADYIRGNGQAKSALVATNSVCQGQQVALLWPHILTDGIEIDFAYLSFRWTNNAKNSAGVICVIVALRNVSDEPKYLIDNGIRSIAKNINAYLIDADDLYITKRRSSIAGLPPINFGSMPNDKGNLIFSDAEYHDLVSRYPDSHEFFKKFVGADDYIDSLYRWCLWIPADRVGEALRIPFIHDAVERVRAHRAGSDRTATQKLADVAYRFGEVRYKPTNSIIIPSVSSERRDYIPLGYLDASYVISNAAFAIYDAEPWVFGIVTSRMHMAWMRTVGGRLGNSYRYAAAIVYNNFPVPPLRPEDKLALQKLVFRILDVREYHCEKTMEHLYDPDKMPDDLRVAHLALDEAVDQLYQTQPFESDEARLAFLFKMYENMMEANR